MKNALPGLQRSRTARKYGYNGNPQNVSRPSQSPRGNILRPLLAREHPRRDVHKEIIVLQEDPIKNAQKKRGEKNDNKRRETFCGDFSIFATLIVETSQRTRPQPKPLFQL